MIIGGAIVDTWNSSCTHLIMDTIVVTVKVIIVFSFYFACSFLIICCCLGSQCFVKLKADSHSKVAGRLCDYYKKWHLHSRPC